MGKAGRMAHWLIARFVPLGSSIVVSSLVCPDPDVGASSSGRLASSSSLCGTLKLDDLALLLLDLGLRFFYLILLAGA